MISVYVYPGLRASARACGSIQRIVSISEMKEALYTILDTYLAVSKAHIQSSKRDREYVDARVIFAEIMRKHTRVTVKQLGAEIGRDHSSICHYAKIFKELLEFDEIFTEKYKIVLDVCEERGLFI